MRLLLPEREEAIMVWAGSTDNLAGCQPSARWGRSQFPYTAAHRTRDPLGRDPAGERQQRHAYRFGEQPTPTPVSAGRTRPPTGGAGSPGYPEPDHVLPHLRWGPRRAPGPGHLPAAAAAPLVQQVRAATP